MGQTRRPLRISGRSQWSGRMAVGDGLTRELSGNAGAEERALSADSFASRMEGEERGRTQSRCPLLDPVCQTGIRSLP